MKKYVACILLLAMAVSMTACQSVQATDLMDGVSPGFVEKVPLDSHAAAVTDFGVRLFQNSWENGKNVLVSPLSVLCALAMTANGAEGETLAQMEAVLGLDVQTLNTWVYSYMAQLPDTESCKLSLANSIWFRDHERLSVEQAFLQTNADYFGASVFRSPFDGTTVKDINLWVKENTDGMIDGILEEIPEEALMYLINALAFDAKWQTEYEKSDVRTGLFHIIDADGTTRDVKLMHSTEGQYLEDALASGFIKYYQGGDYAFVALLPNEGVALKDYVASLTGERIHQLLSDPQYITVYAAIPKFEAEYSCEMAQILRKMGMTDAFDSELADFSALGTSQWGNICISRVLHKTYISVEEKGTRAAAVTSVEMTDACAEEVLEEHKTVILDRPFLYMLIDTETGIPFFIGTVADVQG